MKLTTFCCLQLLLITICDVVQCNYQDFVGWSARDSSFIPTIGTFDCVYGPPGLYCLVDLSGYKQCNADLTHTDIACPAGTRCSCFVGMKCEVPNPCQPFTLPPSFPSDVTTVSYGVTTIASTDLMNVVTVNTYKFTKQQFQKFNNGVFSRRGDRQDTSPVTDTNGLAGTVMQSTYNAVGDGSSFVRYLAKLTPSPTNCVTTNGLTEMPLLQIPVEAQPDGMEMIEGQEAQRWVLRSAGLGSGAPRSTEYFYYIRDVTVTNFSRPKRYYAIFDRGQGGRSTIWVNETFGLFYDQLVPSVGFYAFKPSQC